MSEVLVLVDHSGGEVKKVSFELLTAARRIGEPSAVVVGEPGTTSKLTDSLAAHGAEKVYAAESAEAEQYLVTPQVEVLSALVGQVSPAAVLVPGSVDGKEVAGRLAVRQGSGLLSEVVDLDAQGVGAHSLFGGTYDAKAQVVTGTPVVTVLPGSVEVEATAGAGDQQSVEVPAIDAAKNAKVTGHSRPRPATGRS